MSVVIFIVLLIVFGFAIWMFNSNVYELLNDERYIQEFNNELQINIPRKSFPGKISIMLEKLGYLTSKEEIAPIEKKQDTNIDNGRINRILVLNYKFTHIGIEARQKEGFNTRLFIKLFFRLTTSIVRMVALIFGFIAAVITLLIWIGGNQELLICITTNEKIHECVPKIFSSPE